MGNSEESINKTLTQQLATILTNKVKSDTMKDLLKYPGAESEMASEKGPRVTNHLCRKIIYLKGNRNSVKIITILHHNVVNIDSFLHRSKKNSESQRSLILQYHRAITS